MSQISANRLEELKALRKTTLLEAAIVSLPKPLKRARLDCFIYFYVILFGNYRRRKRDADGNVIPYSYDRTGGIYSERRLGYPGGIRIARATGRVHRICVEESRQYEFWFRRFKEARRRWLATRSYKAWGWYYSDRSNPMNVCYHSWLEETLGLQPVFERGFFRYRAGELMPRFGERVRARRQMREALKEMARWREAIFDKMGVPKEFRSLI